MFIMVEESYASYVLKENLGYSNVLLTTCSFQIVRTYESLSHSFNSDLMNFEGRLKISFTAFLLTE